jgi:hypothetical protein
MPGDDKDDYADSTLQVSIDDLASEIKPLAREADFDGDGRISRADVREITGDKQLSSEARKLVEAVGRLRLLGKEGKGREVPLPLPRQADDGWERQKYFGGGVIEEWCASDDARYLLIALRLEEQVPVPTRVIVVVDLDQAMQRTLPGPRDPLQHLEWSSDRSLFTFKIPRKGEMFRVDVAVDGRPLKVGALPYTFVAAEGAAISGQGEAGAGAVVKGQKVLMVTPNWVARTTLKRFWEGEEVDWSEDDKTALMKQRPDDKTLLDG